MRWTADSRSARQGSNSEASAEKLLKSPCPEDELSAAAKAARYATALAGATLDFISALNAVIGWPKMEAAMNSHRDFLVDLDNIISWKFIDAYSVAKALCILHLPPISDLLIYNCSMVMSDCSDIKEIVVLDSTPEDKACHAMSSEHIQLQNPIV
ncbi:hypothetical protein DKX38_005786 [Salix brachista]|uniref:Uncharacterized protein n=1 Tax=Salix brachista TaxID=2182728 RepID=A0A5N5N0M5_9ROSI|nr:hypothetical protein DKX38_005786 [Salix brachista]